MRSIRKIIIFFHVLDAYFLVFINKCKGDSLGVVNPIVGSGYMAACSGNNVMLWFSAFARSSSVKEEEFLLRAGYRTSKGLHRRLNLQERSAVLLPASLEWAGRNKPVEFRMPVVLQYGI